MTIDFRKIHGAKENNGIMKKIYILTGSTGHLGNTIVELLKKEACEIRGLILPSEKELQTKGITYYKGDIRNKASLNSLFENTENAEVYVIHSAGIISLDEEVTPLIYDVNVKGTLNIIELSLEKKIQKLVYISSVDAIEADDVDKVIKEVNSFDPDRVAGGYGKTKAEASQAVLDATKKGLSAVVVHPSAILGPYDYSGTNKVVNQVKDFIQGKMPAYVEGTFDFVDVRDVALGCLLAAEKGRSGETYILSNNRYTFNEFLRIIKKANKGGKKIPKLPLSMVLRLAPLLERSAAKQGKEPLFTTYSIRKLTGNSRFSHDKATKELGYIPRDLVDTIKDTVEWLRECNVK